MTRLIILLSVGVAGLLAPAAALACGGFFCNATAAILQPVEQNAERILFEINGDGTITTVVEISFSGEPEDFSWVVPVPDVPELSVAPASAMLLLDDATSPTIVSQPTRCDERGYGCNVAGGAGIGFGCADMSIRGEDSANYDGGVDVIELPQTGPYLSEVVSSTDASALVDWLNDNGYLITEAMEPFVADYVAQGQSFLAMKLASDAGTSDVAPISMRYTADAPSIPLVLTAVSAEPDMGVMVFVAGTERYQAANWANVLVDPRDVQGDPFTGSTNYYPLVSWLVDQVGGRAMVTEYAGDMLTPANTASGRWSGSALYDEEIDWLGELASRTTHLTRMYTRLSGWEMTSDPVFEQSPGDTVSNLLDLSDNEPIDICGDMDPVPSCGQTYCGEGATCASTEIGDGCVCPAGSVARQIQAPDLNGQSIYPTTVCQRLDFDLMSEVEALDAGAGSDPCMTYDCGAGGTCVALNGFPTCDCAEGGAAVATAFGALQCAEALEVFEPEDSLLPAAAGSAAIAERGASAPGAALAFISLLLPVVMLRRRNSRAA